MEYTSILNSIKRGVFSPVYLFYGSEKYLMRKTIEQIKNKLLAEDFQAFNLDILDGEKSSIGQIVELANVLPVMSDKRMVLVQNPPYLGSAKGQEKENLEPLLAYLERPHLASCLIFQVNGKVDKRKRLYKSLEKVGQVIEFAPLKRPELERWIKDYFKQRDKEVEFQALEYLSLIGNDGLEKLEQELEKLDLFTLGVKRISLEDVQEIISKTPEINLFELLDSIALREGEKALVLMERALFLGEPPMKIIYSLVASFRRMLIARDMLSRGYSEREIIKRLDANPYYVSKIIRQSRNFELEQLIIALERLLETEISLKTGQGQPDELLETLVVRLCYGK